MNFINGMTFYTRLLLLLLIAGGIVGCQSSQMNEDVKTLLEQVEKKYRTLESFRFDSKITTDLNAGSRNRTIEIPLTYIASKPGKMRLEVHHQQADVTLVSNGKTTWTYMPSSNQYTKKQASALQETGPSSHTPSPTDQQFMQFARSLIEPYATITRGLKKAEMVGQTSLNFNGESIKTVIVEATYRDDLKSERPDADVKPTRYWIEPEKHLVLKQIDSYALPSRRVDDSVRVTETTSVQSFELNPSLQSNIFTFEIPEGAQQVSQLSIDAGPGSSSMEGKPAMDFTLPNLSGQKISLSNFKGKIVLLDFWATWCAPCRRAHPDIQDLYEKYKDQGLVVLGINNESHEQARRYMESNSYTFTTLIDTNDTVAGKYGIAALPNYFVIDRQGKISSHIVGYQPKSDMLEALKKAGLQID